MIRYDTSLAHLKELIELESPGWLTRAGERTEAFKLNKKYEEKSSMWSEVKSVYMKLQGDSKCAYCERKLESVDLGKVEQDVEHFRPKGSVKAWKGSKALKDAGVVFAAAPEEGKGYYALPYNVLNYAAACKPCNSVLKKDYFPIAGAYTLDQEDPVAMLAEQPFLLYPIGTFDDDPEQIICFNGTSPTPVEAAGHKRHRALVTIEFFKLDDTNKRKNLIRERAIVIIALYPQLQKKHGVATPEEKAEAEELVKGFTHQTAAHTNCARCFVQLFEEKPDDAKVFFDKAVKLITTIS